MQDFEVFSEAHRSNIAQLRHPDQRIRLLALADIEDEVDDELASEMMRMLLEDPSEEVRARVAIAFGPTLELCSWEVDEEGRLPPPGGFDEAPLSQEVYDRLIETLRRVYMDGANPELVRRRVLEGAVRSPQPWQTKAAAAVFRSESEPWRATAVFCMGYLSGFDNELVEAFESGSELVRCEAIRAAGERGVKRLAGPLLALAADLEADRDERLAAIEALPKMEHPRAFEVLDELGADPDEEIAEAADEALGEVRMFALAEEALGDDSDDFDDFF